jgi:hypothetical protein
MVNEIVQSFPHFREQVRELVEAHRELEDEPLLLALYYAPERRPQDVFLFEVLENFGRNMVDPNRELFEVEGGSTIDFPMQPDQRLHLVLTNPKELEVAQREGWAAFDELRNAIKRGTYEVIYQDPRAPEVLEGLRE